jgi:hypothetical protein
MAFVWGSVNLWGVPTSTESESQQWTFGQVIAIVLLIVPIIALIEGYFKRRPNLLDNFCPPDKCLN